MKNSFVRQSFGLLALLCSTVGFAATVTVTPSTANPAPTDLLTVTISGDALFPLTTGATLGVTYDPAVISIGTATPIAPGFNFAVFTPTGVGTGLVSVISTSAAGVAGPFDAFTLDLTALAAGDANLVFVDDGIDLGWSDPSANLIPGLTYNQASITVAGVALDPDIAVTDSVAPATDLDIPFGDITVGQSSTQTVTVTNSGTGPLNVGQVAGLVAPYSLGTDTCSTQAIAAAASCTIQVNFDPVAAGASSGTLNIPSDDPDTATVAVTVGGNGVVAPTPNIDVTDSVAPMTDLDIPFGSVAQGGTSAQTVTVTNSGSAALNVGQVAGLVAPFSLGTDNCSNQAIAAAGSCTIQVNFDPVAAGPFTGALDIPSDDPDTATVTVNVTGTGAAPTPNIAVTDSVAPAADHSVPFGSVTIGGTSAQTVTVTNSGTAVLNVGAVMGLVAPFSLGADNCSNQAIAAAGTCTIAVNFDPTVLGGATGALTIPSDDPDTATVTVNVAGTGVPVPVPDITVTDSVAPANDLIVDFGAVGISGTESQTITVTNDGSAPLTVSGVVASGDEQFGIAEGGDLCTDQTLDPTESCVITVDFTPDATGVYNGSVTISSDDGDEGTVAVALNGTGVDNILVIDGGSSGVDPLSLALLGGLPLLRRRRKLALKLAAVVAAVSVLAGPTQAADDAGWDWNYTGLYLGAGVNGTSLQTQDSFNDSLQEELDLLGIESTGNFEDFPEGGQGYVGWMFNRNWGLEERYSATADGESDILTQNISTGERTKIGEIKVSLDGWTTYLVGNWPVANRWDLFAKAGWTWQDADLKVEGSGLGTNSESDNGFAGVLGARWRFARHWAVAAEGEYLGVNFDDVLDEPWRASLNVEYWMGGHEVAPPPPPPPAKVAVVPPPPPPPPAPKDTDGDGVVDTLDQCPDTPKGDRVGSAGCSCDVTRQLHFKTNSAELTAEDKQTLDEMAENLTRLHFVSGTIVGHTDNTGSEAYNQALSERRAKSVSTYLESKGIGADRMQVVGRGESDPIGDNTTAEGRAMNRRVVAQRTDCDKP